MSHPLKQLLCAVRRRARAVLLAHGVAWVILITLTAGLALGLLDWALRIDDVVVRLLCCLAWWLGVIVATYRFVYPALAARLGDVQLAQRIQERWPDLGDRLSSAVEFVDQSEEDVLAGSADLRRTVIADAAARVERYRLPEVVDARRPMWISLAAAGLVLVVIAVFCIAPSSASLATRRLMLPLSGQSWPRLHHLAFVRAPRQIASGEDFQVELIDRNGELPDEVEILFRAVEDDAGSVERQPMEYDYAGNRMAYRLKNVTQPFEYRAVGGDDDTMEWVRLDVVQPPRVASLEITLHPPAYTGWPEETSDRHIRALVGTRVDVRGKATKPLAGANLVVDTAQGRTELPARLADDTQTFRIPADAAHPWLIDESGVYGFELTDQQQFRQAARSSWELRAIVDRPPTISLERPDANTYVTARAVMGIKALVKDDLLVRSIDLVFRRSVDDSDAPAETIPLYEGPPQAPKTTRGPLGEGGPPGDSLSINYDWDLGLLEGTQPGDTIEFFLSATDYKPQENACTVRRLTVISAEELAERVAQRQTFILGQLGEAIAAERDARSQTKALAIQLDEVGRLDQQDINQLQSAELNQRRVARLLIDDREGLTVAIESLLADLASNRVDSPDIARRMQQLLGEIRRLGREHLPAIEQQLIQGIKLSQAGLRARAASEAEELKRSLADAGTHQDQVIDSLERLRGQLAKWDSYRRFAREISQLQRDQKTLATETAQRRLATLGRDIRELEAADRALLRRLAERQFEFARRLERILTRMEEMQMQLVETDPLAAETIGDAVALARRLAIAEQMRIGGRYVEANQLGQAEQAHHTIDEGLEEMLALLAGRREHELARLLRKLQQATAELEQAIDETKGLQKKLQDTEGATRGLSPPERRRELQRLTADQSLQQRVERLARQLKRLQAEAAGTATARAAQKLAGACQAGQQGDAPSASENTRGALEDLEDAAARLKQQTSQLEQDLLQEQLARLEQQVDLLRQQQQAIRDETRRLRELELQQQRLTRGQTESVRDLARDQRALADETRAFGESIAEAIVFHAALAQAADDMNRAAARLARRLVDDTTQQIQDQTVKRFDDVLAALKPDQPAGAAPPPGAGQPGGQGGRGRITSLAELKLLKMLQEDVHRRTVAFQESRQRRGDALTDEMIAELTELAGEQGRIAQLMLDISEPADNPPEANPDDLPDVREELPLDLDQELEKSLRGE